LDTANFAICDFGWSSHLNGAKAYRGGHWYRLLIIQVFTFEKHRTCTNSHSWCHRKMKKLIFLMNII